MYTTLDYLFMTLDFIMIIYSVIVGDYFGI